MRRTDDGAGGRPDGFGETVVFLDFFNDLPDRARPAGDLSAPEVLLLRLLAVLARVETFVDIARFGDKKVELLRRFRRFAMDTPRTITSATSCRPRRGNQRCFVDRVAALTGRAGGRRHRRQTLSPLRRKEGRPGGDRHRLGLRRRRWCSARSRWRRSTRSSPSPSCSVSWRSRAPSSPSTRSAASATSPRNPRQEGRLRAGAQGQSGDAARGCELFAAEQKANGFKDATVTRHQTVDGDHGRIETRTYTAIHDVDWLKERHDWPGLQGVVMVESTRKSPTRSSARPASTSPR